MNGTTVLLDPLATEKRAYALDALRGFAILTMVLSGVIPFGPENALPDWMYHAQVPPPDHRFNPNLPGITWVDLVFPFFIFSMGAAIPLALSRRIERGMSMWEVVFSIFKRGLLLAGFAIFDQHIRPYGLNSHPATATWLVSLLGFVIIFPILVRLPQSWKPWLRWSIRGVGWISAILFLALVRYPDGSGFSLYKSDIIILVLSNVAFFGSLIWLISRSNILFRLSWLGILIAIRLSHSEVGWVQWLWDNSPAPWLYKLYYLQYLDLIIPGTIVGEMIVDWMKSRGKEINTIQGWGKSRLLAMVLLMFSFIIVMLIGLKIRWVLETTVVSAALCGLGWWMFSKPSDETEKLLSKLFRWGVYWLALGLVFEPYEGGIKKDHPTMSYYFVTAGLAIFLLIAFSIIMDVFKKRKRLMVLVENGQNPMIAYAGVTNFIPPLLALTGIAPLLESLTPTPWLGFIRGLFVTLLLALAVSVFTKKKIYLRT
jgi:predicted acyltransferase